MRHQSSHSYIKKFYISFIDFRRIQNTFDSHCIRHKVTSDTLLLPIIVPSNYDGAPVPGYKNDEARLITIFQSILINNHAVLLYTVD
jgi:hypothetical protein